jgi:hypothetical protein
LYWPHIELCGCHRALARCGGDSNEVLPRVLDFDDVSERRRARDDDVGVECEGEHDIVNYWRGFRDIDRAPENTEIDQPKCQFGGAGRHAFESVSAFVVGRGRQLRRAHEEVDRHARERRSRLIDDAASHTALRLSLPGTYGRQQE